MTESSKRDPKTGPAPAETPEFTAKNRSRREALKRIGMAGLLGLALPSVLSSCFTDPEEDSYSDYYSSYGGGGYYSYYYPDHYSYYSNYSNYSANGGKRA
jgi:hypothetical protein